MHCWMYWQQPISLQKFFGPEYQKETYQQPEDEKNFKNLPGKKIWNLVNIYADTIRVKQRAAGLLLSSHSLKR